MDTKPLNFSFSPLSDILVSIKVFPHSISAFQSIFPLSRILIISIVPIWNSKTLFFILYKLTFIKSSFFGLNSNDFLSLFPFALKDVIRLNQDTIPMESLIFKLTKIKVVFLNKFYREVLWLNKLVDRDFIFPETLEIFYCNTDLLDWSRKFWELRVSFIKQNFFL